MEEIFDSLLTQTANHPLLLEEAEEEAKELVVLEEAEELIVLEEAETQVFVYACLKHKKI